MVKPGIQTQAEALELCHASHVFRITHQAGSGTVDDETPHRAVVRRRVMAHTAQTPFSGSDLLFQDACHGIPEGHVRVRNDAGCHLARAVWSLRRGAGQTGDPFDLPDRSQRFRAGCSPSRLVCLDVDGADDFVTARKILLQVAEAVVMCLPFGAEQMMMGVDNRQMRLHGAHRRCAGMPFAQSKCVPRRGAAEVEGRAVV